MPPAKRTRHSTALIPADQETAQAPAVDLTHLKVLLELLVKSAARQHGVTTADAGIEDIKAKLDAALAQQEEEAAEEQGEGDEDDEDEEEGEGEEGDGDGAMGSIDHATHSTDMVMAKLEEIQEQVNDSKHQYDYAGNPSSQCGVCVVDWEWDCGWKCGKGNWACFPCQVFICSFECLNAHNKECKGKPVASGKRIYTKEEWKKAKDDPNRRGRRDQR
tara:strand:- start:955 stop:1608 length:654 start_codon:yes stop_codon:yes gene_type:complete